MIWWKVKVKEQGNIHDSARSGKIEFNQYKKIKVCCNEDGLKR